MRNLSWEVTEDVLRAHLQGLLPDPSTELFINIPTKKADNGETLSMGYAFVETRQVSDAKILKRQGDQTDLMGRRLTVEYKQKDKTSKKAFTSSKRRLNQDSEGDHALNTRIIVRNLPFVAKKREVREFFNAHGKVKAVRLPKNFEGRSRGFGFVDFISHQEAVNSMEALMGVHLYGRPAVMEWAREQEKEEEEEVEETVNGYNKRIKFGDE